MELSLINKKRRQAEADIVSIIEKFMKETGMETKHIVLNKIEGITADYITVTIEL
jgi:hypothetical protein